VAEVTILTESSLPNLEIFSPEFERDPHAQFAALRDSGATLARSERGVEVLGYDTVNTVLRDRRFYWPGVALMESNGITSGPVHERWAQSLINLNGEPHAHIRRLAMLGFNRSTVEDKRAAMARIVEQLLDELMDDPTVEFATQFAQRLPSLLFCEMVGSPLSDAPRFADWSLALNKMLYMDPKVGGEVEAAWLDVEEYITEQIPLRRDRGGTDLLSALLDAEERDGRLDREELTNLMVQVLLGSTDSTANQLSLTVLALARNPAVWDRLRNDPGSIPSAVEEGLRVAPRQIASLRVSDEDVEIDGVTVAAGTMVGVCVAAANRDPRIFSNPDIFDVDRPRGKAQLSFGAGVHSCIGSGVARIEMEEALGVLTRRLNAIRELPGIDMRAKGGHVVEVYAMPVEFTAA
jgi:cytochrome P450